MTRREQNRQRILAEREAKRQRKRDADRERKSVARARAPDVFKAKAAAWRARNPDKCRAHSSTRRARLRSAVPATFGDFDAFVIEEAHAACRRRAAMTGYAWEVDHLVPLSRGGGHRFDNIQSIPAWLNQSKHARMVLTRPGEWLKMLPGA